MPILQACAIEKGQERVPAAAKLDFKSKPDRRLTAAWRPLRHLACSAAALIRPLCTEIAFAAGNGAKALRLIATAGMANSKLPTRQRQCWQNVRSFLAGIGRSARGTSIVRDAAFG